MRRNVLMNFEEKVHAWARRDADFLFFFMNFCFCVFQVGNDGIW